MNKLLILSATLSFSFYSTAMEEDPTPTEKLTVYAIPGQNGLGSEPDYIKKCLGSDIDIIKVTTPGWKADLGQKHCLQHVHTALERNNHKPGIIHATSQGTATALNYFNDPQAASTVKALILEATLASGNSAIFHTATGPLMNMDFLRYIPGSYYVAPYFAKALMPLYWPAGQQPIRSIKNIPNETPVVIIHSKNDPQLSFDDACALYYGLRSQGNDNAYFLQRPNFAHINLLDDYPGYRTALAAILARHKLISVDNPNTQYIKECQPDPAQFKQKYDNIMRKETVHRYIPWAACASTLAYVGNQYLQQ